MAGILEGERTGMELQAPNGPIGFIGAGRVGTALAALLSARGVPIAAVSSRSPASALRMAAGAGLEPALALDRAETLKRASIVFLTVPDDAIGPLCAEIAREGGWREGQGVVHCSGALPSDVLAPAREAGALVASFHPLQAFASAEAAVANMPGSAFTLEGDAPLVERLEQFVLLLGGTPLRLEPGQKTLYHAAASIASNYTVALAALASDLLVQAGVAPDPNTALRYLLPLMRGTLGNLERLGLPTALTGPLARGDAGTVARHLQALHASAPHIAHLYRELALAALPIAAAKGHFDEQTVKALRAAIEG